jgi:hypothetical protein
MYPVSQENTTAIVAALRDNLPEAARAQAPQRKRYSR